jgi:hypothetical protein
MFSSEENAVIGQPIYLLIAAVVSVVIIAIFLVTFYTTTIESQRYAVDHEIDKILSQAMMMYDYADEGTFITIHVDFPSTLCFIVFGGLPQNGTEQPTNLSLNTSMSNNYYYVMVDGTIHTGHTAVCFSANNSSQLALFRSGCYYINLELVREGEMTYVKVY